MIMLSVWKLNVFHNLYKTVQVHLPLVGLCCLGWIWSKMGKERDAINAFEEALKLPESAFSKLELVGYTGFLGQLYCNMNKKDATLPHYRRSFRIAKELYPDHSDIRKSALDNFLLCLFELEQYSETEAIILEFFDSPMVNEPLLAETVNIFYDGLLNARH
eukprot:m.254069 g.254069  ORF g.254069 m.254069 type:complete len:161 (+) comp40378_c0_seq32:927-1409(+)